MNKTKFVLKYTFLVVSLLLAICMYAVVQFMVFGYRIFLFVEPLIAAQTKELEKTPTPETATPVALPEN